MNFPLFLLLLCLGNAWSHPATGLSSKSGVKNVKDFGAMGDGVTDDTEAIKKAIASTWQAWEQIYIPAGRYKVSNTIEFGRFLTLRGDGPDKTVIFLAASTSGFTNANQTKPVVKVFRGCCNEGQGHDNTTHSSHLFNVSIEVESGNTGAVALDFIAHNGGGVENVTLISKSKDAVLGLSLLRDANGPSHFRNLVIDGFKTGMSISWGVYSTTFDILTIRNFSLVGIKNDSHALSIRNLDITGTGIGIESVTESYGHFLLQKANIKGAGASSTGIQTKGSVYLDQIVVEGFSKQWIHENQAKELPKGKPYLFPEDPNQSATKGSFGFIQVEERPEPNWSASDTWVNVNDYANKKIGDNWGPAIQAAIDAGSTTIYFQNFTHAGYPCTSPIILRGKIRNVIGLSARLQGNTCDVINEVEDSNAVVYIEQLRVDQKIINRSKSRMVLNRSMGEKLESAPNSGTIHSDDWCCGPIELQGGKFFGRGINLESDNTMISLKNSEMWILGLKTELGGQLGSLTQQSKLEIHGGLIYPVQGTKPVPMFYSENSALNFYFRGGGYPYMLEEKVNGNSTKIATPKNGFNVYSSNSLAPVMIPVLHKQKNIFTQKKVGLYFRKLHPQATTVNGATRRMPTKNNEYLKGNAP